MFGAKIIPISGIHHVNKEIAKCIVWQRSSMALHKPIVAISHIIDQIMTLRYIFQAKRENCVLFINVARADTIRNDGDGSSHHNSC